MGKLDGRVALITGASRGIGKAVAKLFAAEGARVACVARTLKEGEHRLFEGSLETTVREIVETGATAAGVAGDVSEWEECERIVHEVRTTLGPVDVLVNNAALTYFFPIAEFPPKKWLKSLAVNVNGPFFLSRLVLGEMLQRRSGAIVNLSSGAAIGPGRGPYKATPLRGGTLYGAEKAALERFTQGLAAEVYASNVCVTCVSPSLVVPTPGVLHHRLLDRPDAPQSEPAECTARAVLLLATAPLEQVAGRVTYSQQILQEFGWIEKAQGIGVEIPGSGYSRI
jgi:NAD(P)-dependent dehydrogenase (short-subunit alcohol dehydrogenase family)